MRSAILAFTLGVFYLQQQAQLWPGPWPLLVVIIGGLALGWMGLFSARRQLQTATKATRIVIVVIRLILCALLGFAWASWLAQRALEQRLPAQLEGKDVLVTGVIDSLPFRGEQAQSFQFKVEQVQGAPALPERLSLSWFHPGQGAQPLDLKPGQRWQLTLRLKRPHGNANPYGFDYEAWLLQQGIGATGSVRLKAGKSTYQRANTGDEALDAADAANATLVSNYPQLLNDFVWSISTVIERTRYHLRDKIEKALPDARYAGVLTALVVGDQREITQADWLIFNRTGIGHLISISGLHITMIAGLFAALAHYLWRHAVFLNTPLCLRLPAPKVAVLAGTFAAFVYVALAGFGIPAQRTLWMLCVVAIAMWTGRASHSSRVLSLALGVVVLLDPWSVLSPGFYLSFAAVASLMYVSQQIDQRQTEDSAVTSIWRSRWQTGLSKLRLAAYAQYAVTLGLVPLSFLMFSQLSLISPIANAIAIPVVSLLVTPLALIGSVLPQALATWVLGLAHTLLLGLVKLLNELAHSPVAVWSAPQPTPWMFALALLGMAYLLAPRGFPLRFLGLICCLPVLFQTPSAPKAGQMQVTVFDVGQGSALLIETAHHRMLYDTGPGITDDSNAGTRILLPYFQARGIQSLDRLMISHADNDHSGGALPILSQMRVRDLSSSLAPDHPIVMAASQAQRCLAGQKWEWDGVQFEVLHPVPVVYQSRKWKPNALSCTLKITLGSRSLLLAGDIEAIQEDELVNSIAPQLASTVLLAPHHGSGTSSTPAFLQAVNPELALFQVGYRNRYRHPKPEVLERYLGFGIKPLRTDQSGAITLQFGDTLQWRSYRETHPRYWYPP